MTFNIYMKYVDMFTIDHGLPYGLGDALESWQDEEDVHLVRVRCPEHQGQLYPKVNQHSCITGEVLP